MHRKSGGVDREGGRSLTFRYVPLMIFLLTLTFCPFAQGEDERIGGESVAHGASALREKWGIEIVRVKITAAGHIVDLRYRVVDPVKAFAVFETRVKPVLVEEEFGRDLSIYNAPRIGGMRQKARRPESGRTYFILFNNPNGLIRAGSKVTFKINDEKVEHISVEEDAYQAHSKGGTGG